MADVRQLTVEDWLLLRRSMMNDSLNEMGPFEVPLGPEVARHLDCANYDACLSHAALNKWRSFSCEGCRKAAHGRFVLED